MEKILTKSSYIAGLGCKAYLWMLINQKESVIVHDAVAKSRMDDGRLVEEHARRLYDNAISLNNYGFMDNIAKTRELCNNNMLLEAGFLHDRCYARIDILIPNNKGHDIIEIKSTTRPKEIHYEDLRYQKHVVESCGISVNRCMIIHLNPDYVRKGDIVLKDLFVTSDVTIEVDSIGDISDRISEMISIIDQEYCPEFVPENILSEYSNPLIEEFYDTLPAGSIFELNRIRKAEALRLWNDGVRLITQIPAEYPLSQSQKIQLGSQQETVINHTKIKDFIDSLEYPISHMDFEAFQSPIPLYDNTRPYQQIPFQYSIHIEYEDNIVHKEYLHEGMDDPRRDFISRLFSDIPDSGTILVYHEGFEKGRLREIARDYPEYADRINTILGRIKDLIVPFRNFYYHDKNQKGSNSIKAILPLFDSTNHSSLNVKDGSQAMILYKEHRHDMPPDIRKDLLEYCCMDTMGMVIILKGLRSIIKK
ncbi:MAG: DUF2779 domain-containing protein [Candidatus Woesearchaeota archaeon]